MRYVFCFLHKAKKIGFTVEKPALPIAANVIVIVVFNKYISCIIAPHIALYFYVSCLAALVGY